MTAVPDPRYVTLGSTGQGSATFRAQKITVTTVVEKVTVEATVSTGGTVTITLNGAFMTAAAMATYVETIGEQELSGGSDEITASISGGKPGTTVKITFYYSERVLQ